jgi:hypothetical protein
MTVAGAARSAPQLRVVTGRQTAPNARAATSGVPTTAPTQLSQLPAQVNLAIYAGDDFSFTLTATNPDNSAVDFTGAVISSQIRAQPGSSTIAATFTNSVAANVITLTLPAAISQTLSGVLLWDIEVTYSTGQIHTLAAGTVSITPDVTRP